jgi:hypothetical protein
MAATTSKNEPAYVVPMAAESGTALPEGPEWAYELKLDGYRGLLSVPMWGLLDPWIHECFQRSAEIRHITSDECQLMNASGCGDQGVHGMDGFAADFTLGDQAPPLVGYGTVNESNAIFEARRELASKPLIQFPAASARRQPLDAVPQLCEGNNAQENVILINRLQPLDNTRVGMWLRPFGYNICIE